MIATNEGDAPDSPGPWLNLASERCLSAKEQTSGFAWVITNQATPLWRGVGLAPGHAEDMYSG